MTTAATVPMVRVNGLHYRYANGHTALEDISFSFGDGERIGLVGPSGAGKSTLLMHLNGLLPEEGRREASFNGSPTVEVAGLPVIAENLREVRRLVGFLFQDPDDQLFCPTVRDDVAFGPLNMGLPRDEVERRIAESLAAVGLSGYEYRGTTQLSTGERKRVCLAGVLACAPALLALDEPSSNLDPRARRTLLQILREFPGAQLIATHDLDLVCAHCPRVIVLDEGRIRADGPTLELLSDAALMERHGLEVPWSLRSRV